MAMSEREIIQSANFNHLADARTLLEALEAFYMNGVADEWGGDVESLTGHFYRVDRWIVFTDVQGFRSVETFANHTEAEKFFASVADEYAEWDNDES